MEDRLIPAQIQAAATRSPEETTALAASLARHCWPGGGDRTEVVSREWLKRWSPVGVTAVDAGCAPAAVCWTQVD
jgi:hypothetical protein